MTLSLVQFKLVFRGDPVWVNPAEVRMIGRRSGGSMPQACIRFAGLPDSSEIVVEGSLDDVARKLSGAVMVKGQ